MVQIPKVDADDISVFNKSITVVHSPMIQADSNKKRSSNEVSTISKQLAKLNLSTDRRLEDLLMDDGYYQLEQSLVPGLKLRDLKLSPYYQALIVEPLTCYQQLSIMPEEDYLHKKRSDPLLMQQMLDLVFQALRIKSFNADREQILVKLPS